MGLIIGVGNTKPTFPYDLYYGIEWDTTVSATTATRVGRTELHQSLPIQSKMRRCLLNDAGEPVVYLHPTDSSKLDTGGTAILDGSNGMVMVEIPAHYRKFEAEGTKRRCLISEKPLPGFHLVPLAYRSAYQATVERGVNKLASVVNNTPAFRGGGNNASRDGTYRTDLGMPATNISLTNFRNYARNRGPAGLNGAGWNCDLYEVQKTTYWLYTIEYANFNSQAPHNAALDANGFRQGGLGDGVTNLGGTAWSNFNGYYPFIPCGYTNQLGNATGVVNFTMPPEYDNASGLVTGVPSYRGLENPFGHIWQWTDGLRVRYTPTVGELYVQHDPAKYNSEAMADYIKRGDLPPSGGYIKELMVGEFGENMPSAVGGSSKTYFADNHYQPTYPTEGELIRGVYVGGGASDGASAGLSYSYAFIAVSYAGTSVGSRLCFLPA